jgi:squalene-associated FAD-dependent desaturase
MAFKADVLVLGGGFAGLSCAAALAEKGAKVLVLEKKPHLGGRAYSFEENGLAADNGQHLFMGCYTETRRFLKRIGTEDRLSLYDETVVHYAEPGGRRDVLSCPRWLPFPLSLAAGLVGLKGLTLSDKLALRSFDSALRSMKTGTIPAAVEAMTVRQWLSSIGQSANAQARFFDPVAIGILNDKPELASAAGFVQALRRIFLGSAEDAKFGLARTGLSDLYTDAARDLIEKKGGRVISTAKAAGLIEEAGRVAGITTDMGSRFDAGHVVSTLAPWDLKKLALPAALRGAWETLKPAPIVGATLKLDRPVMSERFIGLLGTQSHWVFNKTLVHGLKEQGQTVAVVISGAHQQVGESPERILATMKADLTACLPAFGDAKVLASKLVKEPFATLSPVPGDEAKRPAPGSGMPGFSFAGDWTATGLPATIESACASGHAAATNVSTGSTARL